MSACATGRRCDGTWTPNPKDQKPREFELYDLARDPAEKTDVAGKNAVIVARLHILLKQHVKSDLFPM